MYCRYKASRVLRSYSSTIYGVLVRYWCVALLGMWLCALALHRARQRPSRKKLERMQFIVLLGSFHVCLARRACWLKHAGSQAQRRRPADTSARAALSRAACACSATLDGDGTMLSRAAGAHFVRARAPIRTRRCPSRSRSGRRPPRLPLRQPQPLPQLLPPATFGPIRVVRSQR